MPMSQTVLAQSQRAAAFRYGGVLYGERAAPLRLLRKADLEWRERRRFPLDQRPREIRGSAGSVQWNSKHTEAIERRLFER